MTFQRRNISWLFLIALLCGGLPLLTSPGLARAATSAPPPAAPAPAAAPSPAPALEAKAWLLLEVESGQVLTSQAPDDRVEPASLTKLMTAYLTFSALHQKVLSLEQTVPVSEKAWRAQGSRMFIEPRMPVTVEELIKGMIIQSGNDACIALAESIATSEESFAQMMNREAQRLGMKNTSFRNATGLPDPNHYTTARDLSLLASALIRDFPEEYAKYYSMKEFRYNKITQPNRNRLLWMDTSVDGMKTGHTDAAGFCLIASAKRNDRRLLSVLLGARNDAARAQESLKLLNYGFQYFDAVHLFDARQPVASPLVWKGQTPSFKVGFTTPLVVAVPKGQGGKVQSQYLPPAGNLIAPVAQGQAVGVVRVTVDGQAYGDFPVQALEAVPQAGVLGRAWDSLRLMFK